MNPAIERCVVGLGNPGDAYVFTRHNIGFRVLDAFADRIRIGASSFRGTHYRAEGEHAGKRVLFCKPWTYMNLSGEAVTAIMAEENLSPDQLLIVCDEFQLPLGTIRLRAGGGSGGHNGLTSIIDTIGTTRISRLRCGIGPVPERIDVVDFVLGRFVKEEEPLVSAMIQRGADALLHAVASGLERAMNVFNTTEAENEESTPIRRIAGNDQRERHQ